MCKQVSFLLSKIGLYCMVITIKGIEQTIMDKYVLEEFWWNQ